MTAGESGAGEEWDSHKGEGPNREESWGKECRGGFSTRGCFIERVLLFSGKLMGTFCITLHVGKRLIAFVCGYGTNKGNLDLC